MYKALGSITKGEKRREEERGRRKKQRGRGKTKTRKEKENGEWEKAAKARRPCTDIEMLILL